MRHFPIVGHSETLGVRFRIPLYYVEIQILRSQTAPLLDEYMLTERFVHCCVRRCLPSLERALGFPPEVLPDLSFISLKAPPGFPTLFGGRPVGHHQHFSDLREASCVSVGHTSKDVSGLRAHPTLQN